MPDMRIKPWLALTGLCIGANPGGQTGRSRLSRVFCARGARANQDARGGTQLQIELRAIQYRADDVFWCSGGAPTRARCRVPACYPWLVWALLVGASIAMAAEPFAKPRTSSRRVVACERISQAGVSYIDPEFFPEYDLVTFQTGQGEIWVAHIDPESGDFRVGDGREWLMDVGAESPGNTLNGPEFGVDKYGWAVFYTKSVEGTGQVWRARRLHGENSAEPLTSGTVRRQTPLVSKDRRAETVRVIFARESLQGYLGWFDEDDPSLGQLVDRVDVGARWIDGTRSFVYVKQSGASAGQLALIDTETGIETVITGDAESKSFPYGWFAPDYDDALLVCCIAGDSEIAVYRDLGGSFWQPVERIRIPETSSYAVFGSPEPFVVNQKSYLSCVCKQAGGGYVASEVWVLGLDSRSGPRHERRVDDGTPGLKRSDPEVYPGVSDVFVYFNVLTDDGVFEIHKAYAGLSVDHASDRVERRIPPHMCDPLTDGVHAIHLAYRNYDVALRHELLLFFPGTHATPWMYRDVLHTAADMGYHVIGLSYENTASINFDVCPSGTTDETCHRRAREEIWFGVDQHDQLDVDPANAIVNRLETLLNYLERHYRGEGWGEFLDNEGRVIWEAVVTAGHSQGGNHAGFGAKQFPVIRAIMFSCSDWVAGQTADWIRMPGATPESAFFGFIHTGDAMIFGTIPTTWEDFGMLDYGDIVSVDETQSPYDGSHGLISSAPLDLANPDIVDYHNATSVDYATPRMPDGTPVYQPVWQYLLDVAGSGQKATQAMH